MDSCNMLESKIYHFTSFDDISFYLGSSMANSPQRISNNFVQSYSIVLKQAIRETNLPGVGVLIQVVNHILKQNLPDTIRMLISSGLHHQFSLMLGFAFSEVSSKKVMKSAGDQLYVTLLNVIIEYCDKMEDHFNWFFQNMLRQILEIISDLTCYYSIRMQTVDSFLGIFSEDDRDVIGFLRNCIGQNQQMYDQICERAVKSLQQIGDYQLQESIVELIFRMWPTDVRKQKADKWCGGNHHLLTKFLAISYDKFDYGVRMFLNEVNSSSARRKVLTLNYMDLQIGDQTLVPTNQWSNCVDFCYESKELSIRFPTEESSEDHRGSWNTGSFEASDLVSFRTSENPVTRSIDLHIEFENFTSQVLKEFQLMDELATNLIIRFYRVAPLDASHLLKFTSSLFGNKYADTSKHRRKGAVSQPQAMLIMNEAHSQYSDHNTSGRLNSSYINMPHAHGTLPPSQRSSQAVSVRNSQKLSHSGINTGIQRSQHDIVPSSQLRGQTSSSDGVRASSTQRKPSKPSTQPVIQESRKVSLSSKLSNTCIVGNCVPVISLKDIRQSSSKPHKGDISSQMIRENKMMNNLAIHAVNSDRESLQSVGVTREASSQAIKTNRSSQHLSQRRNLPSHVSQKLMSKAIHIEQGYSAISKEQNHATSKNSESYSKSVRHAVSQNAESAYTKLGSRSVAQKVDSVTSGAPSVCHSASSAFPNLQSNALHSDVPTRPESTKSSRKRSKSYEAVQISASNLSSKPNPGTSTKNRSKFENCAASHSSDDFQENTRDRKQKSISEIVKESGNTSVDWKDIVPETQAVLYNSTTADNVVNEIDMTANTSADLMLSCLHGEESRDSPKITKLEENFTANTSSSEEEILAVTQKRVTRNSVKASQKLNDSISPEYQSQVLSAVLSNQNQAKKETQKMSQKTSSVNKNASIITIPEEIHDIQKAVTVNEVLQPEHIEKSNDSNTGKKLETASKVNAEFQHLQNEFSDKENINSAVGKQNGSDKNVWAKIVGKGNTKKSGRLFSGKRKKRSLINADMTEPLEDLSLNDPQKLSDVNDSALKCVKKMPYVAKFMKTPVDNEKQANKGRKTRAKGEASVTVIEIFKTDSEIETGKTTTEVSADDNKVNDSSKHPPKFAENALKTLNIDPRPGGLEKAREHQDSTKSSKQRIQKGRRTRASKQKDLELPFGEVEEVPDIQEVIQPIVVDEVGCIETVRDAPTSVDEDQIVIPSPEQLLEIRKKRRNDRVRLLETTDPSEQEIAKKKRQKVSFDEFDFALNDAEDKPAAKKRGKGKKTKRQKKARLFDSLSDATSAASSDLSWVREHKKKSNKIESPKPVKTYLMKNKNNFSPLNLPSLESLTNYNMQDISSSPSHHSVSSPEVVRDAEVSNTSLMSGIAKMQSFSKMCNLAFDDIVVDIGDKQIEVDPIEIPVKESSPLNIGEFNFESLPDFQSIRKNVQEEVKEDEISMFVDDELVNGKSFMNYKSPFRDNLMSPHSPLHENLMSHKSPVSFMGCKSPVHDNSAMNDRLFDVVDEFERKQMKSVGKHRKKVEFEAMPWSKKKKILPNLKTSELARLNNNTPVEGSTRIHIREKNVKKPTKRKAEPASPRSSPINSFENSSYKSKKKLNMRSEQDSIHCNDIGNLSLNASDRSDWLSKQMIKKMGRYIRDVNNTWNMGDAARNDRLQAFQSEVTECEKKHLTLMKEMKQLQSQSFSFIQKFNGKVEKVMNEAANNIMEAKSRHSSLLRELHHTTETQQGRMEKLRSKISDELREMIMQSKPRYDS